jgi:hypothetical protein
MQLRSICPTGCLIVYVIVGLVRTDALAGNAVTGRFACGSTANEMSTKGISDVIVYILSADPELKDESRTGKEVTLEYANNSFSPSVVLLILGDKLHVNNSGNALDVLTTHSVDDHTTFALKPGQSKDIAFRKTERDPFVIDSGFGASARLLVRNNSKMTVSDQDGKFSIDDLPNGSYLFRAWGKPNQQFRAAGWRGSRFTVVIENKDVDLGTIEVIEQEPFVPN